MKHLKVPVLFIVLAAMSTRLFAQASTIYYSDTAKEKQLFLDVHHLPPGKITFKGVAEAHTKDVATAKKYGVECMKFWVNEDRGLVYCLASATDSNDLRRTHAEAHGMLPDFIYVVTGGKYAKIKGDNPLFLDIHELGPGNVTAEAAAECHRKDLGVGKKYGVNFINYWVDVQRGTVLCLAQSPDSASLVNAHREAHGLIPLTVMKVKQGQ